MDKERQDKLFSKCKVTTLDEVYKNLDPNDVTINPHVAKTDDEIQQLAKDISRGTVFTSNHISSECLGLPDEHKSAVYSELMHNIFLPLALAPRDKLKQMIDDEACMSYEYTSNAVGGVMDATGHIKTLFPAFMTLSYLNKTEYKKLCKYVSEMADSIESIMARMKDVKPAQA